MLLFFTVHCQTELRGAWENLFKYLFEFLGNLFVNNQYVAILFNRIHY